MYGPPRDSVITLPQDWQDHAQSLQCHGPEQPLIKFLQKYIQQHGWKSIAAPVIQDLAVWATGLDDCDGDTHFPDFRNLFIDIEGLTGPWAIQTVINECEKEINAHPIDLSRKLDACQAEWKVLQYLLKHDWQANKCKRQKSGPDWEMTRDDRTIGVEVKQKTPIGTARHALAWWLNGLLVLQENAWMHGYTWKCHISNTAKISHIKSLGESFQKYSIQISSAVVDELKNTSTRNYPRIIDGTDIFISPTFKGYKPAIELYHNREPDAQIVVELNDMTQAFSIGRVEPGWAPQELGETEASDIRKILSRLGADKQNTARSNSSLFVFVWWVPPAWNHAYDRSWMHEACNNIATEQQLDYVAIWPCGHFNINNEPFVLNTKAAEEFPELGR